MGLLGKAVLNQQPRHEPAGYLHFDGRGFGGESDTPDTETVVQTAPGTPDQSANERPDEHPDSGLDEMGKVLRDRLLSLSGTEPETAISLLKAYGSFRAGACLSLDGGVYRSYAAVGIGNSIELSPDLLRKIPDGNRRMVDYSFPKGSIPAGTKFWAFSLDENDGDPPARILLVGEDKNYIFPGDAVESLVRVTKSVFKPLREKEQTGVEIMPENDFSPEPIPEEQPSAKKTEGGLLTLAKKHSLERGCGADTDNPDEKELVLFLSGLLEKNGSVRGLVFEGQADVSRIRGMVSAFAVITELKAGCCLVAGDQLLDCELLSHRLSASLPGKKPVWFDAENLQEALGVLRAYL
jgi:hypothetical protein